MISRLRFTAITTVLLAPCLLYAATVQAAMPDATDDTGHPAVSVRSFTIPSEGNTPMGESRSVTVADMDWGGIETLDVPQTESPAERAAREQAEREKQARAAAIQQTQQSHPQTPDMGTVVQEADVPPAEATATPPTPTEETPTASPVLLEAEKYLGVPYVYGGSTPAGFDCSGLTQYVFGQLGISLPRTDVEQRAWAQSNGMQVPPEEAQPGDLMWHPGHVGIYAGNGMILHAPTPGDVVRIQDASYASFEYYRIL